MFSGEEGLRSDPFKKPYIFSYLFFRHNFINIHKILQYSNSILRVCFIRKMFFCLFGRLLTAHRLPLLLRSYYTTQNSKK